jgi:outer membrane protein TolC
LKKLFSLLVVFVISFTIIPTCNAATELPTSLTMTEAIRLATKNSNQLAIYKKEIETNKVNVQETDYTYKDTRSNFRPTNLQLGLIIDGYGVKQAELGLTIAEMTLDNYVSQLELKVKTDYYNLKSAMDKQEKTGINYSYANENLWIVHNKWLAGTATLMEDLQATLAKSRAKVERNAAARDIDYARKTLNVTLGLPMTTTYELVDSLPFVSETEFPDILVSSPDNIIDSALKNKLEIVSAKGNLELSELNFTVTQKYTQSHTFKYQQAEIAVQTAEEKLKLAEQNAQLAIYKAYNDAMNSLESMQIAKSSAELAEQSYLMALTQYDAGLTVNSEVINVFSSFKDAQISFEQIKLSYAINIANYEALTTW